VNPKDLVARDEEAIRDLIARWRRAAIEGDLATLQELIAPDVLFLIAHQPLMDGRSYLDGSAKLAAAVDMTITGEVNEILVSGDLAVARQTLEVNFMPKTGGETTTYAGQSLIVFRRAAAGESRWLALRDANLLGPKR
jgi:uncharacterized protein (TIGR02246 family)